MIPEDLMSEEAAANASGSSYVWICNSSSESMEWIKTMAATRSCTHATLQSVLSDQLPWQLSECRISQSTELRYHLTVVFPYFGGPGKVNTQVNSVRKLQQFFSMQVEAMLVVLSHTLRMEFTVQLFNRRSMYCVDMFPKIMLQGGGEGGGDSGNSPTYGALESKHMSELERSRKKLSAVSRSYVSTLAPIPYVWKEK